MHVCRIPSVLLSLCTLLVYLHIYLHLGMKLAHLCMQMCFVFSLGYVNLKAFILRNCIFCLSLASRASSSHCLYQVSVGSRQTWNVGAKPSAKTSFPPKRPRRSWNLCGRPYRMSHLSFWRPLPSSPLASPSTSLQEKKLNVRMWTKGVVAGLGGCDKRSVSNGEKGGHEKWKWDREK